MIRLAIGQLGFTKIWGLWGSKYQQLAKTDGENNPIFDALPILEPHNTCATVAHDTLYVVAGVKSVSRPFFATPIIRHQKPVRPDMQNLMLKALRRRSASVQWISSTSPNIAPLNRITLASKLYTFTTPAIVSGELGVTNNQISLLPFTYIPEIMGVSNHMTDAERDNSEEIQKDFAWDGGALKLLVSVVDNRCKCSCFLCFVVCC